MPSKWETEYQRFLAEARVLYVDELLPEYVEALYLSFADAIDRIVSDMGTGIISPERAAALEASIIDRLIDLADQLGALGDEAMREAVELAVEGHTSAFEAARRAAGVTISQSFADIPVRALDRMIQRRGFAGIFRTLINRNIVEMADDVELYLRSAVARGISGRRGGRELAAIMARGNPALLEVLQNLGPRGGRTAQAIRQGIEIPDVDLQRAKSILFDGYRILVTETNHAYHEGDRLAAADSPVVDLVRWTLSGRHAGLPSSPDTCDICAQANYHGFGPGLYHPRTVPPLQHQFCQCSTQKVLRPPTEWTQPKRAVPEPGRQTLEEAKRILERAARNQRGPSRSITPKHIERQLGIANSTVQRSFQVVSEEAVEV